MGKNIKFPLILNEGKRVRTMHELRENFDLENIVNYYLDGTLKRWLKCRSYEEELINISKLNTENRNFSKELCYALGINYKSDVDIDIKNLKEKKQKSNKLKNYIAIENIRNIINNVAFDQEDLTEILKAGKKVIYLYNGEYSISLNKQDIEYIGIGHTTVLINSNGIVNLDEKNIILREIFVNSESEVKVIANKSDIKYGENIINLSSDVGMFTKIIQERSYEISKLDKGFIDFGIKLVREAKVDREASMITECGNLIRFLHNEFIITSDECKEISNFYSLESTWNKSFSEKKIKEIKKSNLNKIEKFEKELKIIEEILKEILKSKELTEKI